MANKKQRRGFFAARVEGELPLVTLGSGVVVGGDLEEAGDNEFFAISADLTAMIKVLTAGEGPIHVGLAHGDYTDAEIEEWFEASQGFDRGDKINNERQRRKIRDIGVFAEGGAIQQTLNHGNIKRYKLGWVISDAQTIRMWARNASGSSLTTGAVVNFVGKVYGRWL